MPPCSARVPTIKPVTSWKKTSGIFPIAIYNKPGGFVGAVAVNHAANLHFAFFRFRRGPLVCDNTDRPAVDARVGGDKALPVPGLVLVNLAVVDDARKDLVHIVRFRAVLGHEAIEFHRIELWFFRNGAIEQRLRCMAELLDQ